MDSRLDSLLTHQAGVISRAQALEVGVAPHDLARLVRRRELARLHPGVFVAHTGEPTWLQWAWGGVLGCWPAALAAESAIRAVEGPGDRRDDQPVHVVVDHRRTVVGPPGVRVARSRAFAEHVQWNTGPPRTRYEEAVLDVALRSTSELASVAVLAGAVQGRRTTARRLRSRLDARARAPRRGFIAGVLDDVAAGTCSVLEHGYLTRIERPHGLRGARRQVRTRTVGGTCYRDVEYDTGLIVELDGRLFHDSARQRDADLDRDLVSAAGGQRTVRLSWGQVFERSCWTAARLARLLEPGGASSAGPCGPSCSW